MAEMTSPNNNTPIGGTICGSPSAPYLELLENDNYLEERSLTIAQKKTSWMIPIQTVDGKKRSNMK